jgi:hypothetical protein
VCLHVLSSFFLNSLLLNTYSLLSFLDGQSTPCFHPSSSIIQMTSGSLERLDFLVRKRSVQPHDQTFTSFLTWGLAVVPVGAHKSAILSPTKEAQHKVTKANSTESYNNKYGPTSQLHSYLYHRFFILFLALGDWGQGVGFFTLTFL